MYREAGHGFDPFLVQQSEPLFKKCRWELETEVRKYRQSRDLVDCDILIFTESQSDENSGLQLRIRL